MTWRFTLASVQGTSHVGSNLPCQDSSLCKVVLDEHGAEFLVLVASDGAGSAAHSDEGSHIVCQYFMTKLTQYITQGWMSHQIDENFARRCVITLTRHAAQMIKRTAVKRGIEKREFAATLVLAIVSQTNAIFFQLGDGGIVVDSGENYEPIFWPHSGEYVNMTYFITDNDAVNNLQFKILDKKVNSIALFTDGIQGLALKYDTQTAHSPFFNPLFSYLRQVPEDNLIRLKDQLEGFLASKDVNDKTDDDKTLILACRIDEKFSKEIDSKEI
jgi:hypothetical protein